MTSGCKDAAPYYRLSFAYLYLLTVLVVMLHCAASAVLADY